VNAEDIRGKMRERGIVMLDEHRAAMAACNLLITMDHVLGLDWRRETLNQGDEGDELNAAWDELVEAVEGGA
jgi:hypothetical protein